jgi:hypothetical protein
MRDPIGALLDDLDDGGSNGKDDEGGRGSPVQEAVAGDGKVKVHYSVEPLEHINDIFGRMRENRIDGRVVMKI